MSASAGKGIGGLLRRIVGATLLLTCTLVAVALLSWSAADPSLTHISSTPVRNWIGPLGAIVSDLLVQLLGIAGIIAVLPPAYWSIQLTTQGHLPRFKRKLAFAPFAIAGFALAWSALPELAAMPFRHGFGGAIGDLIYGQATTLFSIVNAKRAGIAAGVFGFAVGMFALQRSFGISNAEVKAMLDFNSKVAPPPPYPSHPAPAMGAPPAFAYHPPQQYMQPLPTPPVSPAFAQPYPQPFAPAPQNAPYPYVPPQHLQPMPYAHQPVPAPMPHHHPAPAREAPPSVQPARQAWLRPMQRKPDAIAPAPEIASCEGDRLSATDRRYDPDFDRHTEQKSSAIASRFAPLAADPLPTDNFQPQHQEPTLERIEPAFTQSEPLEISHREPAIIMPAPAERMATPEPAEPTVTISPGGFFARITDGFRHNDAQRYKRPPITLLKRLAPAAQSPELDAARLRERSQLLLQTLADFGVKGEIVAVRPGPVVTLFEFEPARGTKSSRVIGLADDIARSMSARAVRIAVVPGVNALGIELPNASREPVGFRELLETERFRTTDARLPMALGKGIGGEPVVTDLARMPHLLVAGTTGSGKSVGVNAMILSLLFHKSPDECRLILIDPKMLELSVYNDIPHLLTPVVTEPAKAVAALNWAVSEMENRYRLMSQVAVRNIEAYNTKIAALGGRDMPDATPLLPHIVVVVDEFADLMAVAGKEIEFAVQRLAQMARAAGIHLIMATQRPSVDIITGTIKANFPTRISFRVTSRIDSRTILNEQGAEQLLGQGDMLYAGGGDRIVRVHGAFVSDDEVEAIAAFLRTQGAPAYVDGITDVPEDAEAAAPEVVDEDHLYDRAVAIVRADRKASISYLQRKLAIGYNRAATLIERMQDDRIVTPPNAAGKRELLPENPDDDSTPGSDA